MLALTPAGAEAFVGDKGYDADPLVQAIKEGGMKSFIPPRSGRTQARECDWFVYKERHLIECFFNKIKQYRRIFTRYENEPVTTWDFYASSQHSSGCGDTSTEPSNSSAFVREEITDRKARRFLKSMWRGVPMMPSVIIECVWAYTVGNPHCAGP